MTIKTYTRRTRTSRKTKPSVWIAEIVARFFITAGGIGTIVAVITVFLFLLYVAVPLFFPASVSSEQRADIDLANAKPLQLGLDEDQRMCWALFPGGILHLVRLDTGELLEKRELFAGKRLTAVSFAPASDEASFGFEDGTLRSGKIGFAASFIEPDKVPADFRDLQPGQAARMNKGMLSKTPRGQFRFQELIVDIKDPGKTSYHAPILLIDQTKTTIGTANVVLTADGKLRLNRVVKKQDYLTLETSSKTSSLDLPYQEPPGKGTPMRLFISAQGDQAFLVWKDGHLVRIDARDRAKPAVAETCNVLDDAGLHVTDVRCLIGKGTLLIGDSSGRVRAWFYAPGEQGGKMAAAHDFAGPGGAVAAIAVSDRSRMAAVAYAGGKIRLLYVSNESRMAEFDMAAPDPTALVLASKDDGLAVASAKGIWQWSFNPGHPESNVKSLFCKMWYEGYEQPEFVWQSVALEPKISLMPLIFGTLKASFYALLFGVPLALLGALYTSEFLHPRAKASVKLVIEMMASLPSVVLGFLAGLVFAQFVEEVLPAVLACLLTLPLCLFTGAYVWQLLPDRYAQIMSRWRLPFICLASLLGVCAAHPMGAVLEQVLFAGDLRLWIDRGAGSAVGGWVFLFIPISAILCLILAGRQVNPWLRGRTVGAGRFKVALIDLGKFVAGCALTLLLAWGFALLLSGLGLDTRDSVALGPYSQRNSMVVGFAMGFAIIPIIYTIAEDALSSVPEHLRAGSLAAGATRWQTAVRIVIPTAMSGLFSAVMIGMGRAVGETMIILMATGNTPVMNGSIFTGFRTLAVNLAVELPEAVRDSTHYRVLFLAALFLFGITFVLNTIAEIVRMRFRRRAHHL